jgi:hypothetical protein
MLWILMKFRTDALQVGLRIVELEITYVIEANKL